MVDNVARYGFRPVYGSYGGACFPKPYAKSVATAYQAQDDGSGFSVDLNVGDPVSLLADGTIRLCNGAGAIDPWGVIVGFKNYYNSGNGRMEPTNKLPGGSTWTGESQRPWVLVVPCVPGQLFEVDVDDAVTATTYAAYLALVGFNANHACAGDSGSKEARPLLDISTQANTESLVWRIEAVSKTRHNVDYSGARVKLIVSANNSQHAAHPATTQVGV